MSVPLQTAADVASDYATTAFIVQQIISRIQTMAMVTVVAVTNDGGVSPVGTVDVIPVVGQLTGDQRVIAHRTVHRLPYLRLQGGSNALIMDPQVGDIGAAGFCSRDISPVKTDPQAAVTNANNGKSTPPGSLRQFDMADGLYFGGFLNGIPEQYIRYAAGGITILSPTKVRVEAPTIELVGAVVQTNGNVSMAQDLQVTGNVNVDGSITVPTGDVTAGNITLKTHHTSGVTPGGGTSGPPVP
jgi:phage baseplate assembly protein gpV